MDAKTEATVRELALAFATLLSEGHFDAAHALLAADLRSALSAETLGFELARMIEYGDGPPEQVEVVMVDDMQEWPARRASDFGWAYVAIVGAAFNEAVSVIVASEGGTAVVRSLEWGRP